MKSSTAIENITVKTLVVLCALSLLILPGCGAGPEKNLLKALGLAAGSDRSGSARIIAATGGTVQLNDEVKLTVPAYALAEDITITIERVKDIPLADADGLASFGQAYRFLPAGTTFDLGAPAILEMNYDSTNLALKGFNSETMQICYYDETLKCYVPVICSVDTVRKKITAQIEHFTVYLPMARALLPTNNEPYVGLQAPWPTTIRAGAPIYVRATVRDFDGALAGVKLTYRKLHGAGVWNDAQMIKQVNPQATLHTYGYLIPASFLTAADIGDGNDIEYRIEATDNLGSVRTSATRRYDVTLTYQPGSLTINPATLDITAGFERYLLARGVDNNDTTFSLVPETFIMDGGSADLENRFAQGILLQAITETPAGSPDQFVAGFEGESATASVTVHAGELESIEILDTNGLSIPGDLAISEGALYEFDVVGRDGYGNTIPVIPSWSADSSIGFIDTDGVLDTTGCHGPGVVTASLAYTTDTQNVYVQSRAKEITAFSINGVDGVIAYPFITVTLPAGADVTELVATFTTSGTGVTVDDIGQESGVTANDFTDPVVYRVTAEDGSAQDYTVSVSVTPAACIDLDEDGYGENCSLGFDCNDYDPNIHPGAQEICDGLDNDCDGVFDADSSSNYLTQPCYDGDPQTIDVGECHAGIQTCLDGYWGACEGQVLPSEEVCDGEDNDCDADYDENLTRACYTGPLETRNEGLCQDGTQTCFAGEWGACEGEVLPSEEICGDFLDNDCNAEIDEICM